MTSMHLGTTCTTAVTAIVVIIKNNAMEIPGKFWDFIYTHTTIVVEIYSETRVIDNDID